MQPDALSVDLDRVGVDDGRDASDIGMGGAGERQKDQDTKSGCRRDRQPHGWSSQASRICRSRSLVSGGICLYLR